MNLGGSMPRKTTDEQHWEEVFSHLESIEKALKELIELLKQPEKPQ